MKSFLKNLGPLIMLIGAIVIAFYFFNPSAENTLLIIAGILMVAGLIAHIIINRFIE